MNCFFQMKKKKSKTPEKKKLEAIEMKKLEATKEPFYPKPEIYEFDDRYYGSYI